MINVYNNIFTVCLAKLKKLGFMVIKFTNHLIYQFRKSKKREFVNIRRL